MTEPSASSKPGLSRGLRIVFGLSLALNLLIVGALAGAWLRGAGPGSGPEPRASIARLLYSELPREDRRAMRNYVRDTVDRTVLRQARVGPELEAALRAEPFDETAVRALMDRQATAMATGQRAMRDAWLRRLQDMSPQERAAYADRLREGMKKLRGVKPPRE